MTTGQVLEELDLTENADDGVSDVDPKLLSKREITDDTSLRKSNGKPKNA